MKTSRFLMSVFSSLMVFQTANAAVDNNAEQVLLSKSCSENGVALNNCFTDLPTLDTWVWGTRNPTAASPLLVNIGPGTFQGRFTCNGSGYVSLQGAGMGTSIIENDSTPILVSRCVNMAFSDMTIRNTGNLFGVEWRNGGNSIWTNVHLDMIGYAWYESTGTGCGSRAPGEHHWFNSRITARSAAGSSTAYYAPCDVSWFYGSEIVAIANINSGGVRTITAPGGEVHVYGSVIRALSNAGVTTSEIKAVYASSGGEIHVHGTGIDLISAEANDVIALQADAGSLIHAEQSAFVLQTAGGTAIRVRNNGGTIKASYLWEEGATPPNIVSSNGADMAVATNTPDGQPHLVIYSSACTSKWFDTVTGACY